MTGRSTAIAALEEIDSLLARRKAEAAEQAASRFVADHPANAEGFLRLGKARQHRGNLDGARDATEQGQRIAPRDSALALLQAELAQQTGRTADAVKHLRSAEDFGQNDPRVLQQTALYFTRLNLFADAERCHARAVALDPANPHYLYDLAMSVLASGRMEEAERLLDEVIARAPGDYDAYYNRATLRRQTPERNHVATLDAQLSRPLSDPRGEAQLGYALAKELEDLGEHRRSFAALKRGADARKRMLSYRVEDDESAMREIAATFDEPFFARDIVGERRAHPIFILGLPRSGTTLIDRILSSHSQVESLGETSDFATSLMRAAPRAQNKFDLIRQTANVDFAALGRAYASSTAAVATGAPRAIDKTPVNFLYLGLIARALPNATIIHARRDPMDVCYAMYKTLFRMAYPFSYDLSGLARYYIAYSKLMAHWRKVLPGGFIEVDYETIVADQEGATRKLIADCGLDWEDACLAPERNEKPSLTASAAQVRRKVYGSSVGLWRAYEEELQPLVRALREGGIAIP